jgi:hypothetical protein
VLCGLVLPQFIIRAIVPLEAFSSWRSARSKWQRRAVPVTLISAVKAGRPVRPMLDFVAPMMLDQEKVVHQGLGGFLREAWKKEPAPVEGFLLRWKDDCARLIVQYATEKMTPGKKARFRRSEPKPRAAAAASHRRAQPPPRTRAAEVQRHRRTQPLP